MRIGMTELILIFFVALVVIGPDKLPQYARKLGEALGQFRKASDEAASEIKKSVVEPLEEAQKPLREVMEPIQELDQAVRGNARDVQKSFRNIGRKTEEKKTETEVKEMVPEEPEGQAQELQMQDAAEETAQETGGAAAATENEAPETPARDSVEEPTAQI